MPASAHRYEPDPADVDDLLRAAGQHPLGLNYLRDGHLGTVAITFGCHAFKVVAPSGDQAEPSGPAAQDEIPF